MSLIEEFIIYLRWLFVFLQILDLFLMNALAHDLCKCYPFSFVDG